MKDYKRIVDELLLKRLDYNKVRNEKEMNRLISKNKMSKNLSQIRRKKEDLTQFTEMNFFKILTWVLLFLLFKIMKFGKSTAAINLAHS